MAMNARRRMTWHGWPAWLAGMAWLAGVAGWRGWLAWRAMPASDALSPLPHARRARMLASQSSPTGPLAARARHPPCTKRGPIHDTFDDKDTAPSPQSNGDSRFAWSAFHPSAPSPSFPAQQASLSHFVSAGVSLSQKASWIWALWQQFPARTRSRRMR